MWWATSGQDPHRDRRPDAGGSILTVGLIRPAPDRVYLAITHLVLLPSAGAADKFDYIKQLVVTNTIRCRRRSSTLLVVRRLRRCWPTPSIASGRRSISPLLQRPHGAGAAVAAYRTPGQHRA